MGELRSTTLLRGVLAILLLSAVGGCKRENRSEAESLTASLMFDNASPDAREALASRVDFRITDASFAQWEKAQRNLEKLPRSAIPSAPGIGSTALDRAVSRLESSPYARTAIERTGLSVREFVLQTIALAQAAEAAQTGRSLSGATIPRENFQFIERYTARALYSRSRARTEGRTYDWEADAANLNSGQNEMDAQMQLDEPEHQGDALAEQQVQREELERQAEMERQNRLTLDPPPPRDSSGKPARDSVRDSVPAQRDDDQ
jgi:hypothetical protein